MTERMIDVPGGRIWTNVVGDGPGAPLVVLHGGPGMPSDYLSCLNDVADDRPVIFYDQLGCGRSDRPAASEGYFVQEHFIAEIDSLRETLGLDSFHLLGHSWGGLLAALYALEQPENVQSITFASPLIAVSRWVDDCNRLKAKLPSELQDTIDRHEASGNTTCPEYAAANFEWWRRHVCRVVPFPEDLERALSGMGTECYETMWGPSEFNCTGNLLGMDVSSELGEIPCPTLFTCERYDEATPETLEHLAKNAQYSEFHVFEHSAHLAPVEEPGAFLACVRDFLRRTDRASEVKDAIRPAEKYPSIRN